MTIMFDTVCPPPPLKNPGYAPAKCNSAKSGLCECRLQASIQGHPTDRFGGISVQKTCNRLKVSVREMSSRAFLINAFCFRRDKNDVLGTKIGQLGFSEWQ